MCMNELERCIELKNRGYIYDWIFGVVRNGKGRECRRTRQGYIVLLLKTKSKTYSIKSHRFAWFMFYGKLPENDIDHINGIKNDNRITNLRDVTHQQNQWNQTKAKGYYFDKKNKRFMGYIKVDGISKNLGRYDTEQEARDAYLKAKEIYHIIS